MNSNLTFRFDPWFLVVAWLAQIVLLIMGAVGTVSWFVALIPAITIGATCFVLFTVLLIIRMFQ